MIAVGFLFLFRDLPWCQCWVAIFHSKMWAVGILRPFCIVFGKCCTLLEVYALFKSFVWCVDKNNWSSGLRQTKWKYFKYLWTNISECIPNIFEDCHKNISDCIWMFLKSVVKIFPSKFESFSKSVVNIFLIAFQIFLTSVDKIFRSALFCDRMWKIGLSDQRGCCTIQMQ